jgi:hypothetical protein
MPQLTLPPPGLRVEGHGSVLADLPAYALRGRRDWSGLVGHFLAHPRRLQLNPAEDHGWSRRLYLLIGCLATDLSERSSQILGHVDDDWVPLDEHPGAQEDVPGVLVVRIRDSLNFGAAKRSSQMALVHALTRSSLPDAPSQRTRASSRRGCGGSSSMGRARLTRAKRPGETRRPSSSCTWATWSRSTRRACDPSACDCVLALA